MQDANQFAQSLTGNIRTLECINDRSGRRANTADASADNGSVIPTFADAAFESDEFVDAVDDVIALRIESSDDEWDFVFCVAPQSGNSRTSNNSFSCFLTKIHIKSTYMDKKKQQKQDTSTISTFQTSHIQKHFVTNLDSIWGIMRILIFGDVGS